MPTLVVITGPTGSGKTDLAISVAKRLGCEIVSADSRQIYKGIEIGTAAPTAKQLDEVKHHFIGTLDLDAYYSAAQFETDVMTLLPRLWKKSEYVIMAGGSMMYIDAVLKGIDDLPTISSHTREYCLSLYAQGGLQALVDTLTRLDPEYLQQADKANHRRLIHAIEICIEGGEPYSKLRKGLVKQRPWRTVMMTLDYPRQELFNRINRRVDAMIASGLQVEAGRLISKRNLNALNTVGYKEMFAYFDGQMSLDEAIARIAKNTRVYAKKQLLWLSKQPDVFRLDPVGSLTEQALAAINAPH